MVETVINLRDHALWPKRKLQFEDALAQTEATLAALEARACSAARSQTCARGWSTRRR